MPPTGFGHFHYRPSRPDYSHARATGNDPADSGDLYSRVATFPDEFF